MSGKVRIACGTCRGSGQRQQATTRHIDKNGAWFLASPQDRQRPGEDNLREHLNAAVLAAFVLAATAADALAYDRHVVIVNDTSYTIVEFYASSVGAKTWEEDIFGSDVLYPGQQVRIDIDDGTGYCQYDFRAVYEDGDESVRHGVNVCEIGTYTYTD